MIVPMNHKKIRRLMCKSNFFAKIRRAIPYKKIAKATQEHRIVPNYLARAFQPEEPGKVFLTDITYLQYRGGQTAYLSCIKDGVILEIVTYKFSTSLKMRLFTVQ